MNATDKKPVKPAKAKPDAELQELEAAIAKGWTCVRASKRYKTALARSRRG